MKENWYNVQSKASGDIVDVYIFDEIGTFGMNAQSFIDEIKAFKNSPINLHINCVGGDVFDGMAIYNILKKRTAETTVYIEGIAASMGSVIALAADIYMKKTKLPYDRVKEMMDEETWLNADEALELGFIDSISDAIKVAAKYDVSKFKNITNEEIKSKLNINLKSKTMTEELKNWFNGKIEDIIARVKSDDSNVDVETTEVQVTISDEAEILNKFSDLEGNVTTLSESVADLEGDKETLTGEVERLTALLSKANAKGTEISTDGDPAVVLNNVEEKDAAFWNGIVAKMNL